MPRLRSVRFGARVLDNAKLVLKGRQLFRKLEHIGGDFETVRCVLHSEHTVNTVAVL